MALLLGTAAVESVEASTLNDWIMTNVTTGSTWVNQNANLGATLQIDSLASAYSGGVCVDSNLVVIGGGHNAGMNDAVAILDFREFDTVGWVEELQSTADLLGVEDGDFAAIGAELNSIYNTDTPGGCLDERGAVALSRHTYDSIAPLPDLDGFMIYHGVLPYNNTSQPNPPWGDKEGDLWVYRFGIGWEYQQKPGPTDGRSSPVAVLDPSTRLTWLMGEIGTQWSMEVRNWAADTNTLSAVITSDIGPVNEEASACFNEDDGVICAGMGYGGAWREFDVSTETWGTTLNIGTFPNQGDSVPAITHVPSRFGTDYGTYFGYDNTDGELRRYNGSGWDTIATGGPTDTHVYGRFGFERNHQIFYMISAGNPWTTWLVRPYAHNPDEGA